MYLSKFSGTVLNGVKIYYASRSEDNRNSHRLLLECIVFPSCDFRIEFSMVYGKVFEVWRNTKSGEELFGRWMCDHTAFLKCKIPIPKSRRVGEFTFGVVGYSKDINFCRLNFI